MMSVLKLLVPIIVGFMKGGNLDRTGLVLRPTTELLDLNNQILYCLGSTDIQQLAGTSEKGYTTVMLFKLRDPALSQTEITLEQAFQILEVAARLDLDPIAYMKTKLFVMMTELEQCYRLTGREGLYQVTEQECLDVLLHTADNLTPEESIALIHSQSNAVGLSIQQYFYTLSGLITLHQGFSVLLMKVKEALMDDKNDPHFHFKDAVSDEPYAAGWRELYRAGWDRRQEVIEVIESISLLKHLKFNLRELVVAAPNSGFQIMIAQNSDLLVIHGPNRSVDYIVNAKDKNNEKSIRISNEIDSSAGKYGKLEVDLTDEQLLLKLNQEFSIPTLSNEKLQRLEDICTQRTRATGHNPHLYLYQLSHI